MGLLEDMKLVEPSVRETLKASHTVACPAPVILYVCPTPGCGNHYAAPEFRPDRQSIEAMQFARSQNDGSVHEAHTRIACPACRVLRGLAVDRVPYVVTGVVPLAEVMEELEKAAKAAKKKAEKAAAGNGAEA